MYSVSQAYKDKIQELDRTFEIIVRIEHSKGTLVLGDKELAQGTFNYTDGSQVGEEFTVGGTVASHIEFTLVNKEEYKDINFIGAKVYPTIKLLLKEPIDAHFLQPSQPSKMLGNEEEWEYVPLGVFNIDIADRNRSTINIKAIDNMINLDKPYSLSKLSYPASLYQIYTNICNIADVRISTTSFTNQNYIVRERPSDDLTLRNVLGFVAELSGSFAKFNRTGGLELRWYTNSEVIITSKQRSHLKMGDIEIGITGVAFEVDEDNVYITGTDEYAIDLSDNELLQGEYESVLPNILNKIKGIKFTPYTANWNGNPAMDSGDIITQVDVDGNIYKTIITHSTYKYRGTGKLDGKGLPNISRGFKSTDNRIASIVKKIEKEVGDKLTTLEQEQLRSTELIANMLGGYVHDEEDALYITDTKNLSDAVKIWKWGLGGFGYSDDGGKTYKTGITAEGSIVAELVSANIITADMVNTGLLSSEDGSSWFNLDNGEINIKNQLRFVNGVLTLAGVDTGNKIFNSTPTPPYELNDLWKVYGIAGVDFKICTRARVSGSYVASDWVVVNNSKDYTDKLKYLATGTEIKGGTTTIDNTKVRVNHANALEYTQMDDTGFFRQWKYGKGAYINDIHIITDLMSSGEYSNPLIIDIPIPLRFRGRENLEVFLVARGLNFSPYELYNPGNYIDSTEKQILNLYAEDIFVNTDAPYVTVRADTMIVTHDSVSNVSKTKYRKVGFDLIILGY